MYLLSNDKNQVYNGSKLLENGTGNCCHGQACHAKSLQVVLDSVSFGLKLYVFCIPLHDGRLFPNA